MKEAVALVLTFWAAGATLSPTPATAPALAPNSTLYSDGIPPARYQGNNSLALTVVDDLNTVCGTPPPGKHFLGCVRGGRTFMPNPCRTASEHPYPRILCHELGHVNGWPGTHGD